MGFFSSVTSNVNYRTVIDEDDELDVADITTTRDGLDRTEVHNRKLVDGFLVERVGSFYPKNRPGYTDSASELKVRKRVARTIYSKRLEISKNIVNSPYDNTDEILVSSLVKAKISPHSVTRWDKYIRMLADAEGGWGDFMLELSREIRDLHYLKTKLISHLILFILGGLWISALSQTITRDWGIWSTIIAVTLLSALVCSAVYFTHPVYREYTQKKRQIMGKKTKNPLDMYPATRVI